ncbi:hypothetical protein DPMN_141350 [Dreissena polymorpha]|uniref:Uncharacterized protein n=1 Tax=Dreissena polymorpha TaxID=45954 RepID=A0A9D4G9T6_DREPO|nr:hypothetical protein DPMN_141350 [Dreissena polymorpha]
MHTANAYTTLRKAAIMLYKKDRNTVMMMKVRYRTWVEGSNTRTDSSSANKLPTACGIAAGKTSL